MQVQINTDHTVEGREAMAEAVRGVVRNVLRRYQDRITRVEVHLSDQNGVKSGQDDQRCMMEARLEGRQPIAVTHEAPTLELAVAGAAENLARRIESILGRADRSRSS